MKKKTLGQIKKTLQILVNKFCKLRDCKNGGAICITCKKWYPQEKLQGGHFIPSTYGAVRFNEDNIHAQCAWHCNHIGRGRLIEYRPALIEKIGLERVEWLEAHRNDPVKWSIPDLEAKISEYKEKLISLTSI